MSYVVYIGTVAPFSKQLVSHLQHFFHDSIHCSPIGRTSSFVYLVTSAPEALFLFISVAMILISRVHMYSPFVHIYMALLLQLLLSCMWGLHIVVRQ